MSRASPPASTRSHRAEPPHQRQPGLIGQSFHTNATRPHRVESPHQRLPGLIGQSLYTNTHQAPSGRAPIHQCLPGLIEQSLCTNANQASSGRVCIPTPSRPHRAEPLHQRLPALIEQSFHTDANQASSGGSPYTKANQVSSDKNQKSVQQPKLLKQRTLIFTIIVFLESLGGILRSALA